MRALLILAVMSAAASTLPARADDAFKLASSQRIACGRSLMAGKLATAMCRSYAYVFNATTSEFYRCTAALTVTRDAKQVTDVKTEGECAKKPRIFDGDSNYSFDAAETEPPNTNSFFGAGGFAIWASDNTTRKVRGCISIPSGLGADITKCMDMKFE